MFYLMLKDLIPGINDSLKCRLGKVTEVVCTCSVCSCVSPPLSTVVITLGRMQAADMQFFVFFSGLAFVFDLLDITIQSQSTTCLALGMCVFFMIGQVKEGCVIENSRNISFWEGFLQTWQPVLLCVQWDRAGGKSFAWLIMYSNIMSQYARCNQVLNTRGGLMFIIRSVAVQSPYCAFCNTANILRDCPAAPCWQGPLFVDTN